MPLFKLLACSVCTFLVLYAPQPLLPLFVEQFNVSIATAGSLMSLAMLPLAIAPLCYGILLNKIAPLKVLRFALCILAISNTLFALSNNFQTLLLLRLLQGLTLPAALIAMTSYIGHTYQGSQLQKNMTLYIGSSILGGYLGRMLSASFATWLDWHAFYFLVSIVLLILAAILPSHLAHSAKNTQSPLQHLMSLKDANLLRLFAAVFCMFFCFSALLNYLPFIAALQFNITESDKVGWIYTGYLIGAVLSMSTPWLNKSVNNPWLLLSGLFTLYSLTIALLISTQLSLFLISFTLFCASMFMIHATAAPLANQVSTAAPSITNGAYVSFYYSGGAIGSLLPGVVLQSWGYQAFLGCLLLTCLMGLGLCWQNYKVGISKISGV